ncbi:NAD(P)-binding domain-containing protein [Streptomyces sp. NPDC006307]|uniref:NADPH-dependent F420 reductase n=1 Tax=Streptomyces sp. NPDC006307 TaxID=3156748 RepID=UPI00339F7908
MKIGILGTGHVGKALAAAWAAAGHDIVFGSRRADDTELRGELAAAVNGEVAVMDPAGAVAAADVVVNATPGTASVPLLETVGAPALAGKVVLDVAVGFREDNTLSHPVESLGEEIQRTFPEARVVKTLCTVDAIVMVAPGSLEGPSTVFLSGDDADAKHTVSGLLHDLGWPPEALLDLGGIDTARGQEHYSMLFIALAGALSSYGFGMRVVLPGKS